MPTYRKRSGVKKPSSRPEVSQKVSQRVVVQIIGTPKPRTRTYKPRAVSTKDYMLKSLITRPVVPDTYMMQQNNADWSRVVAGHEKALTAIMENQALLATKLKGGYQYDPEGVLVSTAPQGEQQAQDIEQLQGLELARKRQQTELNEAVEKAKLNKPAPSMVMPPPPPPPTGSFAGPSKKVSEEKDYPSLGTLVTPELLRGASERLKKPTASPPLSVNGEDKEEPLKVKKAIPKKPEPAPEPAPEPTPEPAPEPAKEEKPKRGTLTKGQIETIKSAAKNEKALAHNTLKKYVKAFPNLKLPEGSSKNNKEGARLRVEFVKKIYEQLQREELENLVREYDK